MTPEEAEEYTQGLAQNFSGSWRLVALAHRLGVPKALGLTTDQWVKEHLGAYVKMTIADRRGAVKELTAEGYSTREAAAVLGVDHATVGRDAVANATEGNRKDNNINTDKDDFVAHATDNDKNANVAPEIENAGDSCESDADDCAENDEIVSRFIELVVEEVEDAIKELIRRRRTLPSHEMERVQQGINAIERAITQWRR